MKTPRNDAPILVTGGSGYIASHVVAQLLQAGRAVRTTVRDKGSPLSVAHLVALAKKAPGTLTLFEADLLEPGSFDEAAQGCQVVIHMASPFKLAGLDNPVRQLIVPAVEGTRNVLRAAERARTVERVVLTSSVAAVYGDSADLAALGKTAFDDKDWNTTSSETHQPYSYSKTAAEREAWKLVKEFNRFDLVCINPGFVMGPSLSKRADSTSIDFMINLAGGKFKMGVPDLRFALVDVRDVAAAHIAAATLAQASGRYILTSGSLSVLDMADLMRARLPRPYPLPKRLAPKFIVWLAGPSQGFSRRFVKQNVGWPLAFDNSRSISELRIQYTSPTKTLVDHVAQLEADGLLLHR
ncbi:MAG: NAD-dependent epimerase/dehydratase family protein [Myxococcota bacterium]|nr:NAD-dependent epimerase/dehydratase family protein [Myxococcota bacterium]